MNEKTKENLNGFNMRVQFCLYCFERMNELIIANRSTEETGGFSFAIGMMAQFYSFYYFSNISELFNKLKHDSDLDGRLKSNKLQRIELREKIRNTFTHSVNFNEITKAFIDEPIFKEFNWHEDLKRIEAYIAELMKIVEPPYAEAIKKDKISLLDYVGSEHSRRALDELRKATEVNHREYIDSSKKSEMI